MARLPYHLGIHLLAAFFLVIIGGCQASEGPSLVKGPMPYIEMKYRLTVRQQFDFSCGAATLATILTHYWNRPTGEADVLDLLRSRYPDHNWKSLQEKGFSLDDLIWASNELGFAAQAVSLPAAELRKIDGPIIVHMNNGTFEHFSVLRARRGDRSYLSDPVEGAVSVLNEEFDRQYTGFALAVWKATAPLPEAGLFARPHPPIDPSAIVAGPRGGEYYVKIN